MLRAVSLCVIATLMAGLAQAQNKLIKDGIVGAWSLVAVTADLANGSKSEPFGADPKGIIIFTPDGHFALFQSRAELPKIASNDRAKATAEEAAAIIGGSIAYFGTYSVDEAEKSLSVTLDGSTFPNLLGGPAQKRLITSLDTNELKFANPRTPSGMTLQTVWKRAEAH
jgi:Lipocalin-like domain